MMLGEGDSLVQVNYRLIAQTEPYKTNEKYEPWVMCFPKLQISCLRYELLSLFIIGNQSLSKSSINKVIQTYSTNKKHGGFCYLCRRESKTSVVLDKDAYVPGESIKFSVSCDNS